MFLLILAEDFGERGREGERDNPRVGELPPARPRPAAWGPELAAPSALEGGSTHWTTPAGAALRFLRDHVGVSLGFFF